MRLSIAARLTYDFAAPCETVLMIEAARSPDQVVHKERLSLSPSVEIARLDDSVSGERRCVFDAEGRVEIDYSAEVEVLDRSTNLASERASAIRDLPGAALKYLRASRYCPSDRFEVFVHREFNGLSGGAKVQAILDWIAQNLEYRPGVSDASTTAQDTFVERAGVCRDFTHLALTMIRAADIPARAVSAYAWKLQPPDLHAVAEVWLGGRWRLVDPTRLAPVKGLVRVATGRDAADIAFMHIFGSARPVKQSFSVKALPGPPTRPRRSL